MKRLFFILAAVCMAASAWAEEHSYVWNAEFPNYKQQIPSSDFTTADGLFRFTSDKAQGVSGPQFNEDKNAGLLLRLYADNTLRIESLSGDPITDITFVIGGNGHYKLANLTPSKGAMGDPISAKTLPTPSASTDSSGAGTPPISPSPLAICASTASTAPSKERPANREHV